MDLLDRLLGHDHWTTRELLLRSRGFSDEQLDRRFAIGHGSLRATFDHIIWNIEAWTDLMCGRPVRPKPAGGTVEGLMGRLDQTSEEFAALSQRVRDEGRWDESFADTEEAVPRMKTLGGGIAHVITHSMHHRAQVLNIMRQLGVTDLIEGDVLGWENGLREGGWERRPPEG
jgi:uncharacterized damage-inducible protein DinB